MRNIILIICLPFFCFGEDSPKDEQEDFSKTTPLEKALAALNDAHSEKEKAKLELTVVLEALKDLESRYRKESSETEKEIKKIENFIAGVDPFSMAELVERIEALANENKKLAEQNEILRKKLEPNGKRKSSSQDQ